MTFLLRFYDVCRDHATAAGLPDRRPYLVLRRISRAGSRCCGGVRAQEYGEDRARPRGALNIKKSAVPIENVLDDREPEPGPAHLARARGVDAIEAFGQPRQMLACNTVAAVAHGYRYKCAPPAIATVRGSGAGRGNDRDVAAGATIFDAVVDEILKNLGEFVAVTQHFGQILWQVEPYAHAVLAGAQLQRIGEVTQQRAESHAALRHHMLVELDPRQ